MWAQLRSEVGRDDNTEGGIELLSAQKMPPKTKKLPRLKGYIKSDRSLNV